MTICCLPSASLTKIPSPCGNIYSPGMSVEILNVASFSPKLFLLLKCRAIIAYEYIRHIDSLVSQLNSIGYRTPDEKLIHITLNGFPSTWSHFVSNFSGKLVRDPPPTYHDLFGRLHSEQFYKDGQQCDADEESNLVSHFSHRGHEVFRPRQLFQQYRPPSFSRGGVNGSTQANSQHYTNPQAAPMPI